jgi:hypothetical protein
MPLGPPPAETVKAAYTTGDASDSLGQSVVNLSKQFQKSNEVRAKLAKKSAKADLAAATEARAKHIMTNQHGWTADDLNKYGHKTWTKALEFHQEKEREKYDPAVHGAPLSDPTTTSAPDKK